MGGCAGVEKQKDSNKTKSTNEVPIAKEPERAKQPNVNATNPNPNQAANAGAAGEQNKPFKDDGEGIPL